ncbi:hypothetical protein PILCRDRAFT_820191 [Piloderma croceum F 1598]|uniref:Secreted protein n=1 Tax=Piloderma croceum (strain F 1598) TaxID=765440 RepID=A0A0C3BZU8_PILCF|nr:hypothetical protein PILCRDRAFT_820191 [Piloderma croceum F 1598]
MSSLYHVFLLAFYFVIDNTQGANSPITRSSPNSRSTSRLLHITVLFVWNDPIYSSGTAFSTTNDPAICQSCTLHIVRVWPVQRR